MQNINQFFSERNSSLTMLKTQQPLFIKNLFSQIGSQKEQYAQLPLCLKSISRDQSNESNIKEKQGNVGKQRSDVKLQKNFFLQYIFAMIFDRQKLLTPQRIQMINKTTELIVYLIFCFFMCERKSWNKMEDKILKLLYEERGYKKWSDVAQIMRTQYGIQGRNGKQCRQRYHNHLDQRISKSEWTKQEDSALLRLHSELGNRWALIAREIKGRTDNCVKNRFYSRFRRSIRNVNGLIKAFWKKQFKQLKPTFISKVIQITQDFRSNNQEDKKELFDICQGKKSQQIDLKCRLMKFSDVGETQIKQNVQRQNQLQQLIKQINYFNKKNKRKGKKKKLDYSDIEDEEDVWSQQRQRYKSKNRNMNMKKYDNKDKKQTSYNQIKQQVIIKCEKSDQEYDLKEQVFSFPKIKNQKQQRKKAKLEQNKFHISQKQKQQGHQSQKVILNQQEVKIEIHNENKQQFVDNNSKLPSRPQFLNKKEQKYDGFDINQFYNLDGSVGMDINDHDLMYFY